MKKKERKIRNIVIGSFSQPMALLIVSHTEELILASQLNCDRNRKRERNRTRKGVGECGERGH